MSTGNGSACTVCGIPSKVERLEYRSLLHEREVTNVAADLRQTTHRLEGLVSTVGEQLGHVAAIVASMAETQREMRRIAEAATKPKRKRKAAAR